MKRIALALLAVALLTPSAPSAKMNPLKVITDQFLRPEIAIVFDSSGSMLWTPNVDTVAMGQDCQGDSTGGFDVCGDGMCSGLESVASCREDCGVTGYMASYTNPATRDNSSYSTATPVQGRDTVTCTGAEYSRDCPPGATCACPGTVAGGNACACAVGASNCTPHPNCCRSDTNYCKAGDTCATNFYCCKPCVTGPSNVTADGCATSNTNPLCCPQPKSRVAMTRRVLRNTLPLLKSAASFSLFTFANQSGYWTYYKADTTSSVAQWASIFITKEEIQALNLWDPDTGPKTTCPSTDTTCGWKTNASCTNCAGSALTLLSSSPLAKADSLYRNSSDYTQEARFNYSDAGAAYTDANNVKWEYVGSFYAYQRYPKCSGGGGLAPDLVNFPATSANRPAPFTLALNTYANLSSTNKITGITGTTANSLIGKIALATYNNSAATGYGSQSAQYMSLNLPKAGTVYVAYDSAVTGNSLPIWLQSWTAVTCTTDYFSISTGKKWCLYRKDYAAHEQVILGGAKMGKSSAPSVNYFVITSTTSADYPVIPTCSESKYPSSGSLGVYMGPQFTLGSNTYVYRSFGYFGYNGIDSNPNSLEISYDSGGNYAKRVDFLAQNVPHTPSDFDDYQANLSKIMAYLNLSSNGGVVGLGGTPTDEALAGVQATFHTRASGGSPTDPAAACRKRYALLVTDGTPDNVNAAIQAARSLYVEGGANPIKTLVVGIPGLPSSAQLVLKRIAHAGAGGKVTTIAAGVAGGAPDCCCDDTNCNSASCSDTDLVKCNPAFLASDEKSLADNIKKALYDAITGDYTTAAPGAASVATSTNTTGILGNVALVASTEFPLFRGHLRGFDTSNCTDTVNKCLVQDTASYGQPTAWAHSDLGAILTAHQWALDSSEKPTDTAGDVGAGFWYSRKIYTGVPGALPKRIFDTSGAYNTTDLPGILSAASATATAAQLQPVLEQVAGKNQKWLLGPLINSVPATVGQPPVYGVQAGSHDAFFGLQPARKQVIYVASNSGVLHAFDAANGEELWAFVPAHLLQRMYDVYRAGTSDDPNNYYFTLANSPRIEDLYDSDASTWRTELVLTDGPGGEDFVVLDITDPDAFTTSNSVLADSRVFTSYSTLFGPYFGQTWSLPALFYSGSGTEPTGKAAVASGYDCAKVGCTSVSCIAQCTTPGSEGNYFNIFNTLWATQASPENPAYYELASPSTQTYTISGHTGFQYAVVADGVASVDSNSGNKIIATYQADLGGRIWRYNAAGTQEPGTAILTATTSHPFEYAPAVIYMGSNQGAFAAASGAYNEANDWMSDSAFVSKVWLANVNESTGTATNTTGVTAKSLCLTPGPGGTACPSGFHGLPTARPLLVSNGVASNELEAFFLYYDKPTSMCSGNQVAIGDTYLLRVRRDATSGNLTTMRTKKFTSTYASGMSIVANATDVAVAVSGRGQGKSATVDKMMGGAARGFAVAPPPVESWREVR